MNYRPSKAVLKFGIAWVLFTLIFDGGLFLPMARQIAALTYPTTEGRVITSAVAKNNGDNDDCPNYEVSIQYTYVVDGKLLTGSRYRFDSAFSSGGNWAHAVVRSLPAGTPVRVFYNPRNPGNSLLAPGLLGGDLLGITFLMPFNAMSLGFVWLGWLYFKQRNQKPEAGGIQIIREQGIVRVRLTAYSPVAYGIYVGVITAITSMLAVLFLWAGTNPPVRTMLFIWAGIYTMGMVAGLAHRDKIRAGKYDLIIDRVLGTLELPQSQGRTVRRVIRFAEVAGVEIQIVQNSRNNETSPKYVPMLRIAGEASQTERLVDCYDEESAHDFAGWLRTEIPSLNTAHRSFISKL